MQNSMWKLTALAGVVGIVLLVLVQAQRHLQQEPAAIPGDFPQSAALPDGDEKPGMPGDGGSVDLAQSFDRPESEADAATQSATDAHGPAVGGQHEPGPDAGVGSDAQAGHVHEPAFGNGATNLPRQDEADPFAMDAPRAAAASSAVKPLPADDFEAAPASGPTKPIVAAPAADLAARERQATELVRASREALIAGRLGEARAKARQAESLDVAYGVLDDRPELVLADLAKAEQAAAFDATRNVAAVDPTRAEPGSGVTAAGGVPTGPVGRIERVSSETPFGTTSTDRATGAALQSAPEEPFDPFATIPSKPTGTVPVPGAEPKSSGSEPFAAPPGRTETSSPAFPERPTSGTGPQLVGPEPIPEEPAASRAAPAATPNSPNTSDPFGTPAPSGTPRPVEPFYPSGLPTERKLGVPTRPALPDPRRDTEDPFGGFGSDRSAAPATASAPPVRDPEPVQAPAATDPLPNLGSEAELFPDDTPRKPAATEPQPVERTEPRPLPDPSFGSASSGASALAPRPAPPTIPGEPSRLSSASEASPLAPVAANELRGEAVVGDDGPNGEQRPQLKIEKVAPESAALGQPLIYTILVTNTGGTAATQVVVEDRIPKGTELTGTIPRAELVGKKLLWKLGTIAAGEQRKIAVRVTPVEEGEIGSVATVSFVAEVAARTRITSPRLELSLKGPVQARLGEPCTFTFEIRNTGSGDATGVVIRNLIPDGLKHTDGNDLEYEVGRLKAGERREVRLTVTAVRGGVSTNRAVATAEGGVRVEAQSEIKVTDSKFTVSRTGPAEAALGRPSVFTNVVANDSREFLSGVMLAEQVPDGTEFLEASHGGQYNPGQRRIVWRLDRIGPGESRSVQVRLLPRQEGTLASTVRATDAVGAAAETVARSRVGGQAPLGVDLAGANGPAQVGDRVPLLIRTRNTGSDPATNVQVRLDVPQGLRLVSAEGPVGYRVNGSQVEFEPVSSLDRNGEVTIQAVFEADRPAETRVKVAVQADRMAGPIAREEAVVFVP